MRMTLAGMLAWAVVTTTGCPRTECQAASDCAALEQGASSNAPPRSPTYCEGGKCTDAPAATSALVLDLTTPRNVAVESIRYAVIDYHGADLEKACNGRPNCPASTVTCDDIQAEGLEGARFNVALGGVKNTPTSNGTLTVFQGINLGSAPAQSQYLVIEGRGGQLGGGDRLAFACRSISPSAATENVSVTLQAL